ncbi:single-stranded DNA-binding protein [Actinomadura oligospora]|uniref:single-stranded DNA-binding protein n=1 Tax=Actinomadura oligospora TaxID=111804 RepID=UPI0004ACFE40|nr:single-stranded DNA-binding protein [Actinomadura oligospora]
MNEAQITVIGWVADTPQFLITANGTPYLSMRLACTPRRFDRTTGQWADVETMFLTVNCWRGLAENINSSEFARGHPVIVTGRLRIRQYERDGQWRYCAEIEATTLGHDLTRGTADFRTASRSSSLTESDRREAQELSDLFALTGDQPTEEPTEPAKAA